MTSPPGLLARTLAVTLATVTIILAVVFIVLTFDARERAREGETARLRNSAAVFSAQEARRRVERQAMMAVVAEQPQLKAVLDTWVTERAFGGAAADQEQLVRTIAGVLEGVATGIGAETLALLDTEHKVFAAAGELRDRWPTGSTIGIDGAGAGTFEGVAVVPSGDAFHVTGATLVYAGANGDDRTVGTLVLGTALDPNYAQTLSTLANGAGIVIILNDRVVARTVPEPVTADLLAAGPDPSPTRTLDGEEYAVQALFSSGPVRIYTLTSIDAAARDATRSALVALASIAFGGFVLAALASLWLARTLTDPINRLSNEIARMTAARDFARTLQADGTSRELDALTGAFNDLVRGLTAAEAETRSAYMGAIRALAAALDARDPYTAGHSERVSAISVLMAREMRLPEAQVDVIRLGALLHDIGKIGVSDEVLRKAGPLTTEEFEQIKRHPALGARILRQIPFLAPHLPIVELHHERPDGRGYPFGLRGEDIPLAARIVHVADAYDAMTSARAYRPSRGTAIATAELQRCAGNEFDAPCVDALCAALPALTVAEPQLQELLGRGV